MARRPFSSAAKQSGVNCDRLNTRHFAGRHERQLLGISASREVSAKPSQEDRSLFTDPGAGNVEVKELLCLVALHAIASLQNIKNKPGIVDNHSHALAISNANDRIIMAVGKCQHFVVTNKFQASAPRFGTLVDSHRQAPAETIMLAQC